MNEAEILEALQGVERALTAAKNAKQWATHALDNDATGTAQKAREFSDKGIRELEAVRTLLKAKVGGAI